MRCLNGLKHSEVFWKFEPFSQCLSLPPSQDTPCCFVNSLLTKLGTSAQLKIWTNTLKPILMTIMNMCRDGPAKPFLLFLQFPWHSEKCSEMFWTLSQCKHSHSQDTLCCIVKSTANQVHDPIKKKIKKASPMLWNNYEQCVETGLQRIPSFFKVPMMLRKCSEMSEVWANAKHSLSQDTSSCFVASTANQVHSQT